MPHLETFIEPDGRLRIGIVEDPPESAPEPSDRIVIEPTDVTNEFEIDFAMSLLRNPDLAIAHGNDRADGKRQKPCGNPDCSVSSDYFDGLTFGWGELQMSGMWEHPCDVCEEEWYLREIMES